MNACLQVLDAGGGEVLVHGVTGSGKTELYLRVIERALALGRSAIVLVPEIALTPQTARRFRARFGPTVAVLHSGLTPARRGDEHRRIAAGEARVVVGARSAVFAAAPGLGVIVVDEEHDASYKHEADPALRRPPGRCQTCPAGGRGRDLRQRHASPGVVVRRCPQGVVARPDRGCRAAPRGHRRPAPRRGVPADPAAGGCAGRDRRLRRAGDCPAKPAGLGLGASLPLVRHRMALSPL